MTNDHNRFLGLCTLYAYGKLNPRNRHFLEKHLKAGCELCNKELAEIYEAMSLMPLAVSQQSAPSSLRNKVLSAAVSGKTAPSGQRTHQRPEQRPEQRKEQRKEQRQERGRGRDDRRTEQRPPQPAPVTMRQSAPTASRPWFGYAIGFLVVVIIVALGLYTNSLIDRLDSQEQQIIALTNEVQAKEELLKVLQAPRIDMVLMNGTDPSPAGYGKIIWDTENRVAIFQVANLPTVPEDKDYQLWVIKDNTPVSAGVFAVQDEKQKENYFKVLSLNVPARSDVDAFAVTLEPKGGSSLPSGQVYLQSEQVPR